MKNLSTHRVIHSPSCQFTLGVVLALTLFSLTVNAQDPLDPNASVVRYNSNGEITASGTDIGEVQRATGAAEGDVIKVSDGAAFNTRVTNPVNNFTIESASNDVINVPVQAGYNFTQTPTDPFNATFRNVSFTSAENYTSNFWSGARANLTCDNVTFTDFNVSVLYEIGDIQGNVSFVGNTGYVGGAINHFTFLSGSGNTLEFSGNKAGYVGGAICELTNFTGSDNKLLFSGNIAEECGGAISGIENLSGSGNTLKFSNNKANRTDDGKGGYGGAIYGFTNLKGSGNTLEFSENTAVRRGGAIYKLGYPDDSTPGLTGDNNILKFSNNKANGIEASDGGGAIYEIANFSGSGNTLEFSGNTTKINGGAIRSLTDLSGDNNTLKFSKNATSGTGDTNGGGAIHGFTNLKGSGNTLEFSENTAARYGGAIYRLGKSDGTLGLTGNNNKLTFTGNTAAKNGGAIYELTDLSGYGNTLTFSNNIANGAVADTDGGGAIYKLTKLSGSGNTMEFSGNTAKTSGGAIRTLGDLSGNNNTLTFSNNKANGTGGSLVLFEAPGGGAIDFLEELSGSNNSLTFTGNTASSSGGAIKWFADLSGENNIITFSGNTAKEGIGGAIGNFVKLSGSYNKLTFSNNKTDSNTTYKGGAIAILGDLSGSYNTLEFTGNTAAGSGGAVAHLKISGSYNTLTFTSNTAAAQDGGAISDLNLSGSNNTLTFTGNTASRSGGTIFNFGLHGSGNTVEFTDNKAGTSGGAIVNFPGLRSNNNKLTFTGNTAGTSGGAISFFKGISGENNTLTFSNNTAGTNGGAIYTTQSITFSGNNTLTFTGNKAGTKGNDIYSYYAESLTFSGGTYSFDGGIWLAEYNGQTGKTTISDGANVTIAGRNDDSVNEYEFNDVALNANLTATLDDIEYLHGNFSVGENGLMTIKKGSDTATIKSSSDDGGVFDLRINKAENVETISISSGRIDIKGCIDAKIELQNDATFSPGNSVGHVDIDGAFILNAGTTLLIEMDATGIDTMAATSFDLDNGTISFTLSDEIPGGAMYDILTAKNGTPFDEDIITRILNGQTLPEYYTLALAGPNNNIVRFSIDRNAVPEPSTWALLILGAAGLAYMRKRK